MIFRFLRRVSALLIPIFLLSYSAAIPAADSTVGYRTSLSEVYGRYQRVLAQREACNSAYPQARGTYEKAYSAWHARHKKLIDELDQRINMMIHDASKDDREFARNIGRYEGAILRQREEVKQVLLQQPRSDLEAECKALPNFLLGADSDLEKESAEDLIIIRKRPLAKN
jgi:hypothetical protein